MEKVQFPRLPRCWGWAGGDGAALALQIVVSAPALPWSGWERGCRVAELVTVTPLQPSVPFPSTRGALVAGHCPQNGCGAARRTQVGKGGKLRVLRSPQRLKEFPALIRGGAGARQEAAPVIRRGSRPGPSSRAGWHLAEVLLPWEEPPFLGLAGAGLEAAPVLGFCILVFLLLFFLHLMHDLKLFEGLYGDDDGVSHGHGSCGGLVTPRMAGGSGAVPGGWLGMAWPGGGFPSWGFPLPTRSFAGCDPTACADGKSGEGNRTVLSGLWVSAPPRRGWDEGSRAGVRGGKKRLCSPEGLGAWLGLHMGWHNPGYLGLVLAPAFGSARAGQREQTLGTMPRVWGWGWGC